MKKRVLCLVLTLVMMLGMIPVMEVQAIDSHMGIDELAFDEDIVCIPTGYFYRSTRPNGYSDPHDAWDAYLANGKSNNWFTWYTDPDEAYKATTSYNGYPNNLTYNNGDEQCQQLIAEWWAREDAYINEVQDKHTGNNKYLTEEEKQWVLLYSAKEWATYGKHPLTEVYAKYTFQEWKDFLNCMSDDEKNLFMKWWVGATMSDAYPREQITIPFEEWAAHNNPATKPTNVSVATPESTPMPEETKITAMAYPSTQTVTIDGNPVTFPCYALKDENGNLTNYVRIRDLAVALNGTKSEFFVDLYDGMVNVWPAHHYNKPNGSEFSVPFSGERICEVKPKSLLRIKGCTSRCADAILLTDDNGGGYTYYKLRDMEHVTGMKVNWSAETGITIETRAWSW